MHNILFLSCIHFFTVKILKIFNSFIVLCTFGWRLLFTTHTNQWDPHKLELHNPKHSFTIL